MRRTQVDPQTSHKSGKHSTVEKLHASRPDFGASPGNKPIPGAHGSGRPRKKGHK